MSPVVKIVLYMMFVIACPIILLGLYWFLVVWVMRPFRSLESGQLTSHSVQLADLFSLTFLLGLPFAFAGPVVGRIFEDWIGWLVVVLSIMLLSLVWLWYRTCKWMTAHGVRRSSVRVLFTCVSLPMLFAQLAVLTVSVVWMFPFSEWYFRLLDWRMETRWFSSLFRDWLWTWESFFYGLGGLLAVLALAVGSRRLNQWIVDSVAENNPAEWAAMEDYLK